MIEPTDAELEALIEQEGFVGDQFAASTICELAGALLATRLAMRVVSDHVEEALSIGGPDALINRATQIRAALSVGITVGKP